VQLALFIYLIFTIDISDQVLGFGHLLSEIRKHKSYLAEQRTQKPSKKDIIKCTMSENKECSDLFRMENHPDFQEFLYVATEDH